MANQFSNQTTVFLNPRIELNNQGKLLSFQLTAQQHILGRQPEQPPPKGLKVPEDWVVMSRCQACFRKVNNHYYIYDGDGERRSANGLFINNQLITSKDGYLLRDRDEIKIGQNPQTWITLTYFDVPNLMKTGTEAEQKSVLPNPKQRSVSLKNRSIMLGRSDDATLQLEAPTVSRHHATIDRDSQGRYILKDHSSNGVYVNKQKVIGSTVLSPGSIIQISPYTFVLQEDEIVLVDQGDNIRLEAKDICRVVKDKNKQEIIILNHISLAIEPGQLVALVGGSGAGKSTLMKTLLGIEQDITGTVYLNGDNLIKNFNIYRHNIGYVPQVDIIHTNLKVKEVLYYAAKLRLNNDIDIEHVVEKTLRQTELYERQNTLVKKLSGGQLKRVSIGVELLADPKLFFLDEPTSGLDPGLDKKMMLLLRRLANEGRTIILVTHATTNINLCDRLAFLGFGGNLCYFGPPKEAINFFQINSGDFADIYIKLETKEAVKQQADEFLKSDYYREYIQKHLSHVEEEQHLSNKKIKRAFFQQLIILIQRYIKLILRDPVYLGLSLSTAPIGIIFILIAVKERNFLLPPTNIQLDLEAGFLARKVLFVFTCAAMWVGFASSLQEIVKESAIYLRERLVNLSLFAYLGSKIITLGGLAFLQSLLISLVIFISFEAPKTKLYINKSQEHFISFPGLWFLGVFITTFLTIMTAISLGLIISAKVKNSTQANSALPLLLLPEIIFAGILFNMENIDFGKYLSGLMLSRWSVGAYGILANVNTHVPASHGLKMFEETWSNLVQSWGFLILHTIVYLLITFWLQKRKDILK